MQHAFAAETGAAWLNLHLPVHKLVALYIPSAERARDTLVCLRDYKGGGAQLSSWRDSFACGSLLRSATKSAGVCVYVCIVTLNILVARMVSTHACDFAWRVRFERGRIALAKWMPYLSTS
jgi:hypothetical protein